MNQNNFKRTANAFIWLWLLSMLLFFVNLILGTKFLTSAANETPYGKSDMFMYSFISAFSVGVLSLLSFLVFGLMTKLDPGFFNPGERGIKRLLKFIIFVCFLPIVLIWQTLSPTDLIGRIQALGINKVFSIKGILNKGLTVFVVSFLIPIWVLGYFVLYQIGIKTTGYNEEPISISGTGSMYPTFPKGEGKDPKELAKQTVGTPGMFPYPNGIKIGGKRLFSYEIKRGDIVSLSNDRTKEMTQTITGIASGWLKRVIALSGDELELRNGIVYLNKEPLKEPYIAEAQSTFGEGFLKECTKVTVPGESVFVMGDNRKGSGDSREIGFVSLGDIDHILPLKKQEGVLDTNWRDTTNDLKDTSKIRLNKEEYFKLLNGKRIEAGVEPLKYQDKLENSAKLRGEIMLKYNDLSFEAKESGYTMEKAMRDSKYSNITWGESPTFGYYHSLELVENQFEFPETVKFLLNKDYQEIGISEVEGLLNGCPTQIIVQHFAGYVPPNYKQSDIDSWQKSIDSLKGVQGGWLKLQNYSIYNQHKDAVDRINEIISIRILRSESIVKTMRENRWLSEEQNRWIKEDENLFNEEESLANLLNNMKP